MFGKWALTACVVMMFIPESASARGDMTSLPEWRLYGRVQPRIEYHSGAEDDIYIRRMRLGLELQHWERFEAKFELKYDNYQKRDTDSNLKSENAYVGYHPSRRSRVRFGLMNSLFSREGQVSDATYQFSDRSTIVNQIKAEGLADNVKGVAYQALFSNPGLAAGGGVYYDNDVSPELREGRDKPQYVLTFGYSSEGIGDPKSFYFGSDRLRIDITTYFLYMGNRDTAERDADLMATGLDYYIQQGDLSLGGGFFQLVKRFGDSNNQVKQGYYLEGADFLPFRFFGYGRLQLAMRYQQYLPNTTTLQPDETEYSVAANLYLNKNKFKTQFVYNRNTLKQPAFTQHSEELVIQMQVAW